MVKRIFVFSVVLILALSNVFSNSIPSGEMENQVKKALDVIIDCVSASIITNYTDNKTDLTCQYIDLSDDTFLPKKISYFLADPYDYTKQIAAMAGISRTNILANLLTLLTKNTTAPSLTALYFMLQSKNYQPSQFLLSGNVLFKTGQIDSQSSFIEAWLNKTLTAENLELLVNITVSGSEFDTPMNVFGKFSLYLDNSGSIYLISNGDYYINREVFSDGKFRI